MKRSNVVVNHDLDEQTVEELHLLTEMRLGLARKQLANLDDTLNELVSRGLLSVEDRVGAKKELEKELNARIAEMSARAELTQEGSQVHADDLTMYVGLI